MLNLKHMYNCIFGYTFDANSWTICCRLDIFLVYSESFNSSSAMSGLRNENWSHILEKLRWFDHFCYLRITGHPHRFRPMEQFWWHMKHLNSTIGKDLNWKYLQGVNWLYLNICREKFALLRKNLGLFLSNRIYELHILLQLLINTTTVQLFSVLYVRYPHMQINTILFYVNRFHLAPYITMFEESFFTSCPRFMCNISCIINNKHSRYILFQMQINVCKPNLHSGLSA